MSEHPQNLIKEAMLQILSGGTSGLVEVCFMHPLDLVKTRMQLQTGAKGSTSVYYNGVIDCFKKMYMQEGFFSFYKGILPPILAETPKRAVKFFTFEQYKKLFMFGAPHPKPFTFALAGAAAGITEAILVNPFEVVKISLQSNRAKAKDQPSTWAMTRQILKTDGFGMNGLYKGLSGTVARNGTFNMVYFGFYHSVKDFLPQFEDHLYEFLRKVTLGFISGTLASCINIPFDVAKSRIQGPQPVPGQIKYKSLFRTLNVIYAEEGWRALYKGLVPKVLRLGPGGAIMLVVYDYTYNYLLLRNQ